MPSNRMALLGLALLSVLGACEHRLERIKSICTTLGSCAGHSTREGDLNRCLEQLEDALTDQRLTATELTRCASCVGPHGTDAGCRDLVVDRDCDIACGPVRFVLETRTTAETRGELCQRLEGETCGAPASRSACSKELRSAYSTRVDFEARLALDVEMRTCIDCINPRALDLSMKERQERRGVAACQDVLQSCSETCTVVPKVGERLELARAAFGYCNRVQACSPTSNAALVRGVTTAECFEQSLTLQDAGALVQCATCAREQLDCNGVRSACADCTILQLAEAVRQVQSPSSEAVKMSLNEALVRAKQMQLFCSQLAASTMPGSAASAVSAVNCVDLLFHLEPWEALSQCCPAGEPAAPPRSCQPCTELEQRVLRARAASVYCESVRACVSDGGSGVAALDVCRSTLEAASDAAESSLLACARCALDSPDCTAVQQRCASCSEVAPP